MKMKRMICFFVMMSMVMGLSFTLTASAASPEEDFHFDSETGAITWYGGTGGNVVIPDTIGGVKVTSIESQAFYNCKSLTSITIPSGVTFIGGSAFEYCSNLTEITIPDSVTFIGDGAFYNCNKLTEIINKWNEF